METMAKLNRPPKFTFARLLHMKNWWLINSIICIFLTGMVLPINGQNLVSNGSFELLTNCPDDLSQIVKAVNWFQPSLGTPDLIAACTTNMFIGTPKNFVGIQKPKDGQNYAHFIVSNINFDHYFEYVSYKMDSKLLPNRKYLLTYFVSLGDFSAYGMDRIGVLFTINKPHHSTLSRIYAKPQISSKKGRVLADTANWAMIEDTFEAQGGERYLTIGQFFHGDSLQFQTFSNPLLTEASYYVDGVSLYEISIKPTLEIPNVFTPNHDGVNDVLTITSKDAQSMHTQIYNRWGSLVFESNELQPIWDGNYQNQPVADGVYFVVCTATGSGDTQTVEKQTLHVMR